MEVRDASADDAEAIAAVARSSLSASYGEFIDEETVAEMVEEEYDSDRVAEFVDDDQSAFQVAEEDEVIGLAHGTLVESDPVVGEIDWLHVDPDARDRGVGVQLLGRVQEELETRGASVLRGPVLEQNEDGGAFYEDHGFERTDDREVDVGGETFTEAVYEKPLDDEAAEAVVETVETDDGREVHVNYSEAVRGNLAPFYATYTDETLEDRFGYFCGQCQSPAVTMDGMERLSCSNCDNDRAAARWDRSYL